VNRISFWRDKTRPSRVGFNGTPAGRSQPAQFFKLPPVNELPQPRHPNTKFASYPCPVNEIDGIDGTNARSPRPTGNNRSKPGPATGSRSVTCRFLPGNKANPHVETSQVALLGHWRFRGPGETPLINGLNGQKPISGVRKGQLLAVSVPVQSNFPTRTLLHHPVAQSNVDSWRNKN
jgi:hypothetical protein